MTQHMDVAKIILSQLGGNRFIAMTGAKNLTCHADNSCGGLSFHLPRGAKSGINHVSIKLMPSDTYTITFNKKGTQRNMWEPTKIAVVSEVYCDMLQEVFTRHTGLYTRF